MARKIKGFSLIELLVVIAVTAIILSIAIPQFFKWIKKYNIESDTKAIYAFLQDARAKAFAEKIKLDVVVNGNEVCMKCDTGDNDCISLYGTGNIKCIQLKNSFTGNTVNISKRGTFLGGPIYYPHGNEAQYDCIRVSDIRVKMEKCNNVNQNP